MLRGPEQVSVEVRSPPRGPPPGNGGAGGAGLLPFGARVAPGHVPWPALWGLLGELLSEDPPGQNERRSQT